MRSGNPGDHKRGAPASDSKDQDTEKFKGLISLKGRILDVIVAPEGVFFAHDVGAYKKILFDKRIGFVAFSGGYTSLLELIVDDEDDPGPNALFLADMPEGRFASLSSSGSGQKNCIIIWDKKSFKVKEGYSINLWGKFNGFTSSPDGRYLVATTNKRAGVFDCQNKMKEVRKDCQSLEDIQFLSNDSVCWRTSEGFALGKIKNGHLQCVTPLLEGSSYWSKFYSWPEYGICCAIAYQKKGIFFYKIIGGNIAFGTKKDLLVGPKLGLTKKTGEYLVLQASHDNTLCLVNVKDFFRRKVDRLMFDTGLIFRIDGDWVSLGLGKFLYITFDPRANSSALYTYQFRTRDYKEKLAREIKDEIRKTQPYPESVVSIIGSFFLPSPEEFVTDPLEELIAETRDMAASKASALNSTPRLAQLERDKSILETLQKLLTEELSFEDWLSCRPLDAENLTPGILKSLKENQQNLANDIKGWLEKLTKLMQEEKNKESTVAAYSTSHRVLSILKHLLDEDPKKDYAECIDEALKKEKGKDEVLSSKVEEFLNNLRKKTRFPSDQKAAPK